jgi:NADP-dependent aldehyde dehydrogenase
VSALAQDAVSSTVSRDPRTGEVVGTVRDSTPDEVAEAVGLAQTAAPLLAATPTAVRRQWLDALADALEHHVDELWALADRETALGETRLRGEVARVAAQLRFYGRAAEQGSFLGLDLDSATDTSPALVRVQRPVGPVAVFGASNFPFAFGVLGNDTGSALAAGCPVVTKAHPAHAALCERLAEIAELVLREQGAPRGTFALVRGFEAGTALVAHPGTGAVAFTGSQAGGMALLEASRRREVPVPVYAEMGTVNPTVLTRAVATTERLPEIAAGFVASFTLGSGQYCTKPGLLLVPAGSGAAQVVADALVAAVPAPVMLTEAIAAQVSTGVEALVAAGAEVVVRVESDAAWGAPAVVLHAPASAFVRGSRLLEECFGAVVLVVEYADDAELTAVVDTLQGSLTAGLWAVADDPDGAAYLRLLEPGAGRVLVNGWPTGVAVGWAQTHGGPWPSTSDPRTTSVGAAALSRFVRPVTFQSVPDAWLPPEARAANPWRLPRRVDGVVETP